MKKPLIAIFGTLENDYCMLRTRYSRAVTAHGGVPFLVMMYQPDDNLQQIIDTADGFLFAGGIDLAPELYGEKPLNDTVKVDPERDRTELTALPLILKTSKPVLSICRGIQSNNVALGGTLYQDIPSQLEKSLPHSQTVSGDEETHEVFIEKDSKLYEILGEEKIMTNSFHHQSVKAPADGLYVSARSSDGVIEALENKNHPYHIMVQWHPEFTHSTSEISKKLFSSFIKACNKE